MKEWKAKLRRASVYVVHSCNAKLAIIARSIRLSMLSRTLSGSEKQEKVIKMVCLQARTDFRVFCYENVTRVLSQVYSYNRRRVFLSKTKQTLCSRNFSRIDGGKRHIFKKTDVQTLDATTRLTVLSNGSFAKPKRIFPIGEVDSGTDAKADLEALYTVQLTTSIDAHSGLSDPSAGVLLSMIGEHGSSIIYRISPIDSGESATLDAKVLARKSRELSLLRFQRGFKDVATFVGPNLGRVVAIWVAPEAGTWRLEEVMVVISPFQQNTKVDEVEGRIHGNKCKRLCYIFHGKEGLIGDGSFISAAELKPSVVNELSDAENDGLLEIQNASDNRERKRKGLKEYEVLKVSLLAYDAMLITVGTFSAVAMGMDDIANSFALGGMGGFVYLLLLQRAVDWLPGPRLTTESPVDTLSASGQLSSLFSSHVNKDNKNTTDNDDTLEEIRDLALEKKAGEETGMNYHTEQGQFTGFRAPIAKLSWVPAVILLASRFALGTGTNALSAEELLSGAMGFLVSKMAVLLAMYRPLSTTGQNDSEP